MLFELANPKRFQTLSGRLLPWFWGVAVLSLAAGLYMAFFIVPPDYQQGDTVKIMFIHVPAALVGEMAYGLMAVASALGLVNRHPLADAAAKAAAPLGALFTALALVTGSLWGKPMWGTYWVWDARLTSFLILFFLYLGYMALWNAIEDETRAARAAAILALVGAVDLPIVYFSVNWWNTLHQGESIVAGKIAPIFLAPLLVMMAGYVFLFSALWMVRIRTEILTRRARTLQLQAGGV